MRIPLVSVIIPVYNGEDFLAEAIQSILNQDYSNYEIWVMDNGSTDRTREVAQSFPQVQYRYSPIPNVAMAYNQGISLSNGDYIAFLDRDDIWVPHKLTRQVQFLEQEKEHGAVVGLQKIYLQPGYKKPHWLKQAMLETPQFAYLPSALMIRRQTFSIIGCFNPAFPFCSDTAWFFKAKYEGVKVGMIEEVLIHRRIHSENTSNQCTGLQKDLLSTIHASLKERREKKNLLENLT